MDRERNERPAPQKPAGPKPVEQGKTRSDLEKLPDGGKSERVQEELLKQRRDRGYR